MGWTPDGHAIVGSDRLHAGGTFVYFVDDDWKKRRRRSTEERCALRPSAI
jgi:hypothetical protein